MPHARPRALLPAFSKQLKVWPVVGLLGPRQCGKSTFLRELIWKSSDFTYRTLDSLAVRERASSSPEFFLSSVERFPLVIDEVQKAPALFDEIKAFVDRKRIPGRFVISGSVQFSKKTGVRESLTGRIAILRLDTMTLGETLRGVAPRLPSVLQYLKKGGMPGVSFFRENELRENYWEQWLETLCERDVRAYSTGRLSPDLSRRILEETARLDLPSAAEIARVLKVDARRIKSHLEALLDLFVLRPVDPSPHGVGKTLFFPFDSGLASFLGAPIRRLWQVWFLTEYLNQSRFASVVPEKPFYYLTQRGSFIDFELDGSLHLFSDRATPEKRDLMTPAAALKKLPDRQCIIHSATDEPAFRVAQGTFVRPWAAWAARASIKQ